MEESRIVVSKIRSEMAVYPS
jgi:hypothetical protein